MKKIFLATLSALLFSASVNATEVKSTKKPTQDTTQSTEVDAKEKARRAQIEKIVTCKNVLGECKKLGFVEGGFSQGKGLWRNCFNQVLEGKSATLSGKEISVAVDGKDVSACKKAISAIK